jgi:class 3 adenylate cyclase
MNFIKRIWNIKNEYEDKNVDEDKNEDEDEDKNVDEQTRLELASKIYINTSYDSKVSRPRLSTNFFENDGNPFFNRQRENSNSSNETIHYDVMNNVCLCMIDIVGFSSWCSNHIPYIIAKSMLEYNKFICDTIKKFPQSQLKKIELVGDSCMIISGYDENSDYTLNCLNCIRFAVDILKNINHIQNIFMSKYIGVRIGVHLSDMIGVYVDDPQKYQMFGNDINICSRLESSTKPNTLHISEKTLMVVQNMCDARCGPCTKCVKGDCIKQEYKGVGTKTSYIYYLKKEKPLLINFDIKSAELFADSINCEQYDFEYDNELTKLYFQSYKYVCVYINLINIDLEESVKFLEGIIEIKKGTINQYVILLFQDNELLNVIRNRFPFTFDNYLNVNDNNYNNNCKYVFDTCNKSFDQKRGSLDLHIYENLHEHKYKYKCKSECNHEKVFE